MYWQWLSSEQWLSRTPPGCQWRSRISKVDQCINNARYTRSKPLIKAWRRGTLPYCPLGLTIKLLIWPYYNDRGEKWVNAVVIHSRYTKRKKLCWHVFRKKCVSPMSHSKTGRKIKVLKSSDTTSMQSSEQDSISCLTHVPVPKATTHVAFQFFFLWGGTGDALFDLHFPWNFQYFLSALDTLFLPIFEWDIGVTQ